MPYKFGIDTGKLNSFIGMSLRRAVLVALCLVMVFTIAMPNHVMALNLFGQKPQPSLLQSQKVDTTKAQAVVDPAADTNIIKKEDRTIVREDESKRTANSNTYINKDGTKTYEYSVKQKNYRNGNKWEKVDNKLLEVKEKLQNPNFWQTITNTAPTPKTEEFTGKAGTMGVRMMPLSKGIEMLVGGKTVTMKPVGSSNVRPEKKDDSTTIYKDAWKGVDLEYQTEGELIKENIVIKQKGQTY